MWSVFCQANPGSCCTDLRSNSRVAMPQIGTVAGGISLRTCIFPELHYSVSQARLRCKNIKFSWEKEVAISSYSFFLYFLTCFYPLNWFSSVFEMGFPITNVIKFHHQALPIRYISVLGDYIWPLDVKRMPWPSAPNACALRYVCWENGLRWVWYSLL